jgi:uncharacterized protein
MKVVVLGATGRIGSAIAEEVTRRGHEVVGVCRDGGTSLNGILLLFGNASSGADVARVAEGADVVIRVVGPRRDGSDSPDSLSAVAHGIVVGMRQAGVKRLIVVGGAGSLKHGGLRHLDSPQSRRQQTAGACACRCSRRLLRRRRPGLDLRFAGGVSSSQASVPAYSGSEATSCSLMRTGKSRITIPDYAIGIADQLERPTVIRQQITLAC